jgi:regulator of cell morphogenesis and NO signaling
VAQIVSADYRTADVFRKHGIEYCCGGKMPLFMACEIKEVDEAQIMRELIVATKEANTSNTLNFKEWPVDFLADYIINVHHQYLRRALPVLEEHLNRFADGHKKKYVYLDELQTIVSKLNRQLIPHMRHEEEVIFPYIKQITHAYKSKEPYAGLLVKTLRKPVEDMMNQEHETAGKQLIRMRELTNYYTAPDGACVSHRVTFSKLREVDSDITQHIHLENNILFPTAVAIEKELLETPHK